MSPRQSIGILSPAAGWRTITNSNIVNLVLAIFEPIAIVGVIAYWLWRTPILYRLISILCLVEILIGAGFLVFILLFAFTWHLKMM